MGSADSAALCELDCCCDGELAGSCEVAALSCLPAAGAGMAGPKFDGTGEAAVPDGALSAVASPVGDEAAKLAAMADASSGSSSSHSPPASAAGG